MKIEPTLYGAARIKFLQNSLAAQDPSTLGLSEPMRRSLLTGRLTAAFEAGWKAEDTGAKALLQRFLNWESTDFEDDEKREYALCGLADDAYKLLHPDAPLSPREEHEPSTAIGSGKLTSEMAKP
jgi:hypothetical protein